MSTPLIVIPARGGSKGIPRKNIKLLGGRPLIWYSIDVARQIAEDDHIILSTDEEEIASIGRQRGLRVDYMRPASLATDTSGSREVILDVMDYADRKGIAYDCVVLLQPTSPLREARDVRGCLNRYSPEFDMVATVVEARSNPYYNCFETDPESGCLRISKGDGLYVRRQDAPKAWEFNGAVYVINPESIRRLPLGKMMRRLPYPMDESRSIDLDTPADWALCEFLLKESSAKETTLNS